jgi:small subunit ribosomal protein S16
MATKIRLQRHGKKGSPFYYIVVADARAPRDGRFIERVGSYNPMTNPATIDLDFERALYWVETGATPTDTARAILSYRGVMYKKHLQRGVAKGAITQEQADEKFAAWLSGKEKTIEDKINSLASESEKDKTARLAAEKKVNEERAKALAEAAAAAEAANQPVEEATEEVAEEAAAEEAATDATEEPKAE